MALKPETIELARTTVCMGWSVSVVGWVFLAQSTPWYTQVQECHMSLSPPLNTTPPNFSILSLGAQLRPPPQCHVGDNMGLEMPLTHARKFKPFGLFPG